MFVDYRLENGFYYSKADGSGPYVIDGSGNAVLLSAAIAASTSGQILQVGKISNSSTSFAVPNSAATYAIGDLVANSATAGSVTPLTFTVARAAGGACSIIKARMSKTGTGVTGASFELDLFSASPTVTNGDDGVYLPNQAASYLGTFEFGLAYMRVHSDGIACNGVTKSGYPVTVDLSSGLVIYGLVKATGAYVRTAAETFSFTLEIEQE